MTERWAKMVEKVCGRIKEVEVDHINAHQCRDGVIGYASPCWTCGSNMPTISPNDAIKLLARQHRNIRDKVRTLRNRATMSQFQNMREVLVYRQACKDILAALAQQGGGKK